MRGAPAFTLIELLIVVAIISILAAVAIPNFLEAHTRAKVSRAAADMRTLRGAVEAYAVDNNSYPRFTFSSVPWPNDRYDGEPPPPGQGNGISYTLGSWVTTPIAYAGRFDARCPFAFGGDTSLSSRFYSYYTGKFSRVICDRVFPVPPLLCNSIDHYQNEFGDYYLLCPGPLKPGPPTGPVTWYTHTPYDPTNGTVSDGLLIVSQKTADRVAVHPREPEG